MVRAPPKRSTIHRQRTMDDASNPFPTQKERLYEATHDFDGEISDGVSLHAGQVVEVRSLFLLAKWQVHSQL